MKGKENAWTVAKATGKKRVLKSTEHGIQH